MFRRRGGRTSSAAAAAELAAQLAADTKFRRRLLKAVSHGARAQERARRRIGVLAAVNRLATDEQLRVELVRMTRELEAAWARVKKQRSHRLRNTVVLLASVAGAASAAAPVSRRWLGRRIGELSFLVGSRPTVIQAETDVDVPVSTAYNQWTQFEEFPQFMQGVEEVRQIDDTRLQWVASVGGKRAEWQAKILEQRPDQQITWISEDGKKTRGTVTFESLGPARTRVRLSMSYQATGPREVLGSAAGLDRRRVEGDLERFKELIESQGVESGAWRGEISEGSEKAGARATGD